MGSEKYLYFDYAGSRLIAKVPSEEEAVVDSDIHVDFDRNKIHIFDPVTEKAII